MGQSAYQWKRDSAKRRPRRRYRNQIALTNRSCLEWVQAEWVTVENKWETDFNTWYFVNACWNSALWKRRTFQKVNNIYFKIYFTSLPKDSPFVRPRWNLRCSCRKFSGIRNKHNIGVNEAACYMLNLYYISRPFPLMSKNIGGSVQVTRWPNEPDPQNTRLF